MKGKRIMKIEKIVINNETYELSNQKHLNGYLYDSLIYRYIRAREHMAEWEWERDRCSKEARDRGFYFEMAKRDIMRFCEILNEAIGEHD